MLGLLPARDLGMCGQGSVRPYVEAFEVGKGIKFQPLGGEEPTGCEVGIDASGFFARDVATSARSGSFPTADPLQQA